MTRTTLIVLATAALSQSARSQLVLDTSPTVESLVQDVLVGTGVTVSNILWYGDSSQFAAFDGTACNIGLDSGMIMTTGETWVALGPNNSAVGGYGPWTTSYLDWDLQSIANTSIFQNAVVEFDIVPGGDTLRLTLVFASEEYDEWVGASYDDLAAVFLSGHGISGPYTNGAIDIAMVPGDDGPVSLHVSAVNADSNATLFISNGDGYTAPYDSLPYYVQYDGFSVPLTFKHAVVPDSLYHMKIGVTDVYDEAYDSAIFLEAGSLSSPMHTSGIATIDGSLPIVIAPNPVGTEAHVLGLGSGELYELRSCDATGRCIARWSSMGSSARVNVSGLSGGIYTLQVTDKSGTVSRASFVVE